MIQFQKDKQLLSQSSGLYHATHLLRPAGPIIIFGKVSYCVKIILGFMSVIKYCCQQSSRI